MPRPNEAPGSTNDILEDPATREMQELDATRLFEFDPFAPEQTEEAEDVGDSTPPDAPADTDTGDEPGERGEEPQPPKTTEAPKTDPEQDEFRRQLEELREQNRTLLGAIQANQAKAAEPKDEKPKEPAVYEKEIAYNLNVPDQIMQLIGSEDANERRTGITHLANGLATTIHAQVRAEFSAAMEAKLTPILTNLPNMVEKGVESAYTAKEIYKDFYGNFKDLETDAAKRLVTTVAQAVFTEKKTQAWSPEIRDEIAKRVYPILGKPLPERLAPKGKPGPKPGAPRLTPSGGTRSSARSLSAQQQEIADFLGEM